MKNKKAKILSVWWILVLAIIGAGVIAGTSLFFGQDIDARKLESSMLTNRVLECLIEQGKINQDFLDGNLNVFDYCTLNQTILNQTGVYYLNLFIYDFGGNLLREDLYGANFKVDCDLQEGLLRAEHYPKCTLREANVINETGSKFRLVVRTGSNYLGGNLYVEE